MSIHLYDLSSAPTLTYSPQLRPGGGGELLAAALDLVGRPAHRRLARSDSVQVRFLTCTSPTSCFVYIFSQVSDHMP